MSPTSAPAAVGFSYIRFSHPSQAEGDSLRRQTSGSAEDFCKRHGLTLDTSVSLRDLGVSAFKGKHKSDKYALGKFLELAKQGRIPKGSYLIVENLDRLTREEERAALRLWLDILDHGINIVQLSPETVFRHEKSDMIDIMRAIMELSRAHGESVRKSELVGKAWGEKKTDARENGTVQTNRVPAWLEVVGRRKEGKHAKGGEFRVIPRRAAVVRRIFDMACTGYGLSLIVKHLTTNKVEPWGRGGSWSKAYVHKILTGRAVLGEYQPRKHALPEGAPVPNYYPVVIDEDTWQRAQGALAARKNQAGRVGDKVTSLFTGLLWDARTKSRMLIGHQARGVKGKTRHKARVLVPADSLEGRSVSVSFPYQVFEDAVLSLLREVKPVDVIGEAPESESTALAREHAALQARISQGEEEADRAGDNAAPILRLLAKWETERQEVLRRLAAAKHKESNPPGVAWAEVKTLLDAAQDEQTRLRLRLFLRNIVQDIWVLIVPRASHRLAALQVNFVDGPSRHYAIHYWSAGYCRKGGWEVLSNVAPADALDLRRPAHVARLEKMLTHIDLTPPR
jgi:DNA invertase Pin-like site-specific DNA recombinase